MTNIILKDPDKPINEMSEQELDDYEQYLIDRREEINNDSKMGR